jgi:hypothetical protein
MFDTMLIQNAENANVFSAFFLIKIYNNTRTYALYKYCMF